MLECDTHVHEIIQATPGVFAHSGTNMAPFSVVLVDAYTLYSGTRTDSPPMLTDDVTIAVKDGIVIDGCGDAVALTGTCTAVAIEVCFK